MFQAATQGRNGKKIAHRISLSLGDIFLLVLLSASLTDVAWAQRKALVIGNADYAENKLSNPGHDAEDMKVRLNALGFVVDMVENADKKTMLEALNRFSQRLGPDDDAVFFYAGHGAQANGHNYLIPLNAKIAEDTDLEYEALDLGQVLGKLEHALNGFKLAILDACRNNPFTRSFRDGTRGLARIDPPSGTLLWFAAQPGKVAEDGKGRNGTFTQYLLQALSQPGLDADVVFKRTAKEVYLATEGRQFPYPEGVSLVDFKFSDGTPSAASPIKIPARLPPEPTVFDNETVQNSTGKFSIGASKDYEKMENREKPNHKTTTSDTLSDKCKDLRRQWKRSLISDESYNSEC